ELEEAIAGAGVPAPETEPDGHVAAELGDLLFTVVNVARKLNVDPELALRGTTGRFVERVLQAESLAAAAGAEWASLALDDQDRYYNEAQEQPRGRPRERRARTAARGVLRGGPTRPRRGDDRARRDADQEPARRERDSGVLPGRREGRGGPRPAAAPPLARRHQCTCPAGADDER